MMKKKLWLALFLSVALWQSPVSAQSDCEDNACGDGRFGIEGTMATGGNFGIGVTYYTPSYEVGVLASGSSNNYHSRIITPVVFGGLRKYLTCNTVFAYGVNLVANYGKIGGTDIHSYNAGVYISLEYYLSERLMLVGWIDPYAYETFKQGRCRLNTNYIFSTGGLGLAYLW